MSKFLATCLSALALASTFSAQADEPTKETLASIVSQEEPTTPKAFSSEEPTTSKFQLALVLDDTQNKDQEDKKDEPKASLLA